MILSVKIWSFYRKKKNDKNHDFQNLIVRPEVSGTIKIGQKQILVSHYDVLGPLCNMSHHLRKFRKNRFFDASKIDEKLKMADFSKNTCPDKMIVLLQEASWWAPHIPPYPLSQPLIPVCISHFSFFDKWLKMANFSRFVWKSLKYLSDHLSIMLKWKYSSSAL